MAVNAADAWQQSGAPAGRPSRARADRAMAAERPARTRSSVPPRGRPVNRSGAGERRTDYHDEAPQYARPPVPRRSVEQSRPVDAAAREHPSERYENQPRPTSARTGRGPAPAVEPGGSKLRGVLAVGAVFLVTLAAAGIESFVATGLGMITLVALIVSTTVAAFLVRRSDLLSVVVSPPLVFAAVATVNVIAAPSVHLSGVKAFGLLMVTLLVQGFPTMAVATAAALVVGLIRLLSRR